MSEFSLGGLSEVISNIRTVSTQVDIKLNSAMEHSLQTIENKAKQICPVDDGVLRASITHVIEGQGDEVVGKVGSNLEYAPYVHQGTGIHAVNGDGREDAWSYQDAQGNWHKTVGQEPQPFLTDALEAKKAEVFKIFKEVLKI